MTDIMIQLEKLLGEISAGASMHKCHPDEKAIHKLRVRIKMLRALVIMLKWYDDDIELDRLKGLRKLFKKAGDIREWQLLTVFVEKNGIEGEELNEVLDFIKEREKRAYQQYRHTCRKCKDDFVKGIAHWLRAYLMNLKQWPVDYFTVGAQCIVNKLSAGDLPEKAMHKIRRDVKVLVYNMKMFYGESKSAGNLQLTLEFLMRADEALGSWHDARVAENQLQLMSTSADFTKETRLVILQLKKAAANSAIEWFSKFKYDIYQYQK